jgi:hypothetical protein
MSPSTEPQQRRNAFLSFPKLQPTRCASWNNWRSFDFAQDDALIKRLTPQTAGCSNGNRFARRTRRLSARLARSGIGPIPATCPAPAAPGLDLFYSATWEEKMAERLAILLAQKTGDITLCTTSPLAAFSGCRRERTGWLGPRGHFFCACELKRAISTCGQTHQRSDYRALRGRQWRGCGHDLPAAAQSPGPFAAG